MGLNRDIALCVPRLQQAWAYLKVQYPLHYPEGPTLILAETFRTRAVQEAYYAQGRQSLAKINALRKGAGLPVIGVEEAGRRVTKLLPGSSKHGRTDTQGKPAAQAFDVAFVRDGKLVWDEGNFGRAARVLRGQFPDVTWGGDWNKNWKTDDEKFIDMPHFEV
jgi:hypothetical protein